MNVRKSVLSLALILVFLLSACSGAVATTPAMDDHAPAATEVMADTGQSDAMMGEKTPDAMMSESTPGTMMEESHDDAMMAGETPEPMMNETTPDAMMSETAPGAMMEESHDDAMMAGETPDPMMETPAFFEAALADAASGQTFRIKDWQDKVVLVETMAMWCSNCFQQQKQVKELHALLGAHDDFVSLGLDIDPNEEVGPLKEYVEKNGFDWKYAVAPAEMSREIGQLYGSQFLNPTSTPMFIIDRHGQVHPLPFGIKSAESLKEALDPFLSAGM